MLTGTFWGRGAYRNSPSFLQFFCKLNAALENEAFFFFSKSEKINPPQQPDFAHVTTDLGNIPLYSAFAKCCLQTKDRSHGSSFLPLTVVRSPQRDEVGFCSDRSLQPEACLGLHHPHWDLQACAVLP